MVVLVTCKNDEDPFKNEIESTRVLITHNISLILSLLRFFRRSRAPNSVDPGQILLNYEPIQAFIAVLVTCKTIKIQSKIKVLECSQHYTFIFQTLNGS